MTKTGNTIKAAALMLFFFIVSVPLFASPVALADSYQNDATTITTTLTAGHSGRAQDASAGIVRQVDDSQDKTGSYMNIDLTGIATKKDDSNKSTLMSSLISIMKVLVNSVLLPIALVVVIGRLLYIALFPLIMNIDPFDVLDKDTWREGPQDSHPRTFVSDSDGDGKSKQHSWLQRANSWGQKGDWRVLLSQEEIQQIMKQEVIGTIKALVIVFSVWGLLNFFMWLAVLVIGQVK